ncbi:MAG: efflux RND transporter permease subunit, partial [Fuerstiella sp.]
RIRSGTPLKEAVLEAGQRRFRPVLLTSMTTVAGLLPILNEKSFQAQLVIPMATSLCFGLLLSTLLVLVLVPTFYLVYASLFGTHAVEQPKLAVDQPDKSAAPATPAS